MSDDGLGGAVGVIAAMGILYWLGYFMAMFALAAIAGVIIGIIAAIVGIGALIGGLIYFFIAPWSEKKQILVSVPCISFWVAAPFFVMSWMFPGHNIFHSTTMDQMPWYAMFVSPMCFIWLIVAVCTVPFVYTTIEDWIV